MKDSFSAVFGTRLHEADTHRAGQSTWEGGYRESFAMSVPFQRLAGYKKIPIIISLAVE